MSKTNPASYPDWVLLGPQRLGTVRVRIGRVFLPSLPAGLMDYAGPGGNKPKHLCPNKGLEIWKFSNWA